jgi:hypothetical protein
MNIKIKSISIKVLEQSKTESGETIKADRSVMTYQEMLEMKKKIADTLNINPINVLVHYEGRE